jgi:hypothetical protein
MPIQLKGYVVDTNADVLRRSNLTRIITMNQSIMLNGQRAPKLHWSQCTQKHLEPNSKWWPKPPQLLILSKSLFTLVQHCNLAIPWVEEQK